MRKHRNLIVINTCVYNVIVFALKEEELDDLAGQVQMLELAKTKLEMSMAAQKKEHRRELSSKDDELEDARTSTQKKVCFLYCIQLIHITNLIIYNSSVTNEI